MPIAKVIEIPDWWSVGVHFKVPLHKPCFVDGLKLLLDEMTMNLTGFKKYFVDYGLNVRGRYAKLDIFALQT